jgi:predicted amidohydrolase YtcJ
VAKVTRGEFLGIAATLAGSALIQRTVGAFGAPIQGPGLILLNATIYTMDGAMPRAQAFAVVDGRFTAVGSNADIANLKKAGVTVIDAAGATVVPGFIDCHCHPSGVQELYGVNCDLRRVSQIQEAVHVR